jgi:hypothetical protein
MKQIFPSLQRFHIETIMYLIVIIVALILLYLFINNKINLFEGFQATTAAPTTAAPSVNCRSYSNVSGCETTSDQIGRFNLIYFHDAECPYSQEFKTKVWDKIFKSGESELNDPGFDTVVNTIIQDQNEFVFNTMKGLVGEENIDPDLFVSSLTKQLKIWLATWYDGRDSTYTAEKEQYKIRTSEILDKYIKDNYYAIYCKTQDQKMKCQHPNTVVDSDSSSPNTPSTPTTEAVTPLSSVEPDIKYIDRGYYNIHPFFERWFKDIFIITLVNSTYEVEFIKRLSTTDDIINRFEMGWEEPDTINEYTDDEYGTKIKSHISGKKSEYGHLKPNGITDEKWGNKIGKGRNQEMIYKYVQNIIHKKFDVKHTPAIIIEDTERANSENSYNCNTGQSLEDPDVFNFKLSDSYPPESSDVLIDSNYNLILLGQDYSDKDKPEAVPLEDIFYKNIIKFIDDRFKIFDDLGCHKEPIFKPEFYIYVYYGDNCETSHSCLTHIISQYDNIIDTWKTTHAHDVDKFKILFIKVKTSEECKSNKIICMDAADNTIDEKDLDPTKNITFNLHNPNTSTTTTNSGSKPNTIDHDVLNQFIQNYDKQNLKLPYIIMFLKYKNHKAIKSYNWGVDVNTEDFNNKHTAFHTVYAKDIHDAAAAAAAAAPTTQAPTTTAATTQAASITEGLDNYTGYFAQISRPATLNIKIYLDTYKNTIIDGTLKFPKTDSETEIFWYDKDGEVIAEFKPFKVDDQKYVYSSAHPSSSMTYWKLHRDFVNNVLYIIYTNKVTNTTNKIIFTSITPA